MQVRKYPLSGHYTSHESYESMCEWLSRDAWCDVRLLCGGRAFDAHRAVLASVSGFLRRILLSCPIEDTPTIIVLPDFDLEAMSAVLYYIYNGEVTISRQKLSNFLDIVKAMQIFIDQQYLTKLSIHIDIDYTVNKSITNSARVFVLRSEADDSKSSLVTLRKIFQHTLQYNAKDATDYKDGTASRNWNEQFMPVLGNLQSAHEDRQRDYFLRDSFMETYPRNRNANGRAAGVPAIPNGCYRSLTSPFLTNANANGHFGPDTMNLPSDNSAAASQVPYHLPFNMDLTELRRKLPANLSNVLMGQPFSSSLETFRNYEKRMSYLDLSTLHNVHAAMPSVANNTLARYSKVDNITDKKAADTGRLKVAILNKALSSPWCPRLPTNFRPFRRKEPVLNNCCPNDNNNNVKVMPILLKDERMESPTDLRNADHFLPTPTTSFDIKDSVHSSNETSGRGRYACSECGKTFSQLRNYKYHMSVHRGTKEFAASCAVCGKSFNDRGYLSSHMKIHRNRKEYKCSQCPKSFNQRVAYNMHVRIHTGVKPHVCPTCGKAFSRKMLLKQHQRTHSGERPYACPHCEKRFADRSNMTLHLRLHTGVKPFKCPMCPKSFTKKHHLKSHVNFHTGAKPYSCPRCRLAFTQSSNMRTHLKRCTAPEPTDVKAESSA